jgi:predicted helicase
MTGHSHLREIRADIRGRSRPLKRCTLYCYNLRGNQRTAGELARKEGGKIFGSGSRNTVAILLLIKGSKAADAACALYYRDIGDYLSREDKLRIVASQDLDTVLWEEIFPNAEADWIGQRSEIFSTFHPLSSSSGNLTDYTFAIQSLGLGTNRDAWVYNYSRRRLAANVRSTIDFYNSQVEAFDAHCAARRIASPGVGDAEEFIDRDGEKISWSSSLIPKLARRKKMVFNQDHIVSSIYRPFSRQAVYFDRDLNHRPGKLPQMFPLPGRQNYGFYINGINATAEFAVLATNCIPCLDLFGKGGYFFPRYTYRELAIDGGFDFSTEDSDEPVDNITDAALAAYHKAYSDPSITKDDIFFYTYALLHSPEYRNNFVADLKKSLPRIPRVQDFRGFAAAGRKLSDLHLGYETASPYAGIVEDVKGATSATPIAELYRVTKMKIPKVKGQPDRSTIIYNTRVTLSNIPEEAYRYQLGARSAIEWIIDRYQVKTDPASGIVNDPNDWSEDPRYIIDLLKRIVTVSLETMKIVDALPALDIIE